MVLPLLPPPPFQPTAVQESGLVSPSAAAFCPWSCAASSKVGKLAIGLRLPTLAGVMRAPPPSRRVFAGQVAVTRPTAPLVVGPASLFITTWVWLMTLLLKHRAYGVLEKSAPTAPPLPPMPSQWVTSVPTTPVEPVYSVLPSGLGDVPLILLPLDAVPVPMAWSMPPPEIRPLAQAALVVISEKVEPGPAVAPGVFTVAPTVLAWATPGTARASAAPMAHVFAAASCRTGPVLIESSLCAGRCRGRLGTQGRSAVWPSGDMGATGEPLTDQGTVATRGPTPLPVPGDLLDH